MKKKIFLSIVLIFFILCATITYATENNEVMPISEEEKNIEVISNSHFMFEENPSLQDVVIDGNLFVVGTDLSLNNVIIYGDIFVASQNITFSNVTTYGTAFFAGDTINMNNANFAGNIFSASKTMNFTGVAQDIFVAAENISLNEGSLVARDVFAGANTIVLDANVGKDAKLSAEEIIVKKNANIAGILNYSSEEEADISKESTIGAIEFNKVEEVEAEEETTLIANIEIYNVIVLAIKSVFVCGFVFLFGKGFMEKQKVKSVTGYIGINTLKGLGWSILIPIIGILLLFTGVSFGLAVIVFVLYSIILWASVPIVAITITANITSNREYSAWKFYGYSLLISLVIAILKQIALIGGITTVVVGFAAMGIVISSLKNKKEKPEKVEAEIVQ